MSEAELAGGFARLRQASLSDHLHDHYLRRVRVLPGPAQQLMLLAAADPTGDATLLWRAARTLGLGPDAAAAADEEQLLKIGSHVRFRHPLVRSAAYAAGSPEDRRAAHLTLATATDAQTDPERRVWHLAAAATEPDEDVATALEQAAAKIQGAAAGMINYYRSSVRQSPKKAEAALRPISAPTLVIWGQRDRYLGPELAEPDHDDVPNLDRVERLPDASHWVHRDEAERVTHLLTDFFASALPAKN